MTRPSTVCPGKPSGKQSKPWKREAGTSPEDHRCGHPYSPCQRCEEITRAQLRIPRSPAVLRTRADYRRVARWWELEARRGYESTPRSLRYAANMRWAAELAQLYGDGTWPELLERSGHENPEPRP